jgi:hypothetical protein
MENGSDHPRSDISSSSGSATCDWCQKEKPRLDSEVKGFPGTALFLDGGEEVTPSPTRRGNRYSPSWSANSLIVVVFQKEAGFAVRCFVS